MRPRGLADDVKELLLIHGNQQHDTGTGYQAEILENHLDDSALTRLHLE